MVLRDQAPESELSRMIQLKKSIQHSTTMKFLHIITIFSVALSVVAYADSDAAADSVGVDVDADKNTGNSNVKTPNLFDTKEDGEEESDKSNLRSGPSTRRGGVSIYQQSYSSDTLIRVAWSCSRKTTYEVCIKSGWWSWFGDTCCKDCKKFTVRSDWSGNGCELTNIPIECDTKHTVEVKKGWWAQDKQTFTSCPCGGC